MAHHSTGQAAFEAAQGETSGADIVGALVWWDVETPSIARATLAKIFADAGFDDVVPELTIEEALTRSKETIRKGRDFDIVSLRAEGDSARSYGVNLRNVSGEKSKPIHGARVRVVNGYAVVSAPEEGPMIGRCEALASIMADEATELLTTAKTDDFSTAFRKAIESCNGKALRKGPPFFVTATEPDDAGHMVATDYVERVEKLAAAIQIATEAGQVAGLANLVVSPVLKSAAPAMGRSAKSAFEKEIGALKEDLEKAQASGMRADGMRGRVEEARRVFGRVSTMRSILQETADDLQKQAADLAEAFEAELTGKLTKSTKSKGKGRKPVGPAPEAPKATAPAPEPATDDGAELASTLDESNVEDVTAAALDAAADAGVEVSDEESDLPSFLQGRV